MAPGEHESDEKAGRRAAQPVVGFYLVGAPAVSVIERFEGQSVIPRLYGPAVFVCVDLGWCASRLMMR
jgi:hypothetical protein